MCSTHKSLAMEAGHTMNNPIVSYRKLLPVILFSLSMGGCNTVEKYTPPSSSQSYSLLKLKYKYSEILPETNLGTRMLVRHESSGIDNFHSVFHKEYGLLKKRSRPPKIPMSAVKIHSGKKTDLQVSMYYYWYTNETSTREVNGFPVVETCQVYHESACTVEMSFMPAANQEYLIVYNNPDSGKNKQEENRLCEATLYQKVRSSKGNFSLSKIASGKAR